MCFGRIAFLQGVIRIVTRLQKILNLVQLWHCFPFTSELCVCLAAVGPKFGMAEAWYLNCASTYKTFLMLPHKWKILVHTLDLCNVTLNLSHKTVRYVWHIFFNILPLPSSLKRCQPNSSNKQVFTSYMQLTKSMYMFMFETGNCFKSWYSKVSGAVYMYISR